MKKTILGLAALAAAAMPAIAGAQEVMITEAAERKPVSLNVGLETGALFPTNEGFMSNVGLAYGVSAALAINEWLGVGARYMGAFNGETTFADDVTFQSAAIDLKFMAPSRGLREVGLTPYIHGGLGFYKFGAGLIEDAAELSTDLNAQVPIGVGLMVDLGDKVSLGADLTYRFLFNDGFASDPERLDVDAWSATANLIFKL